MKIHLGDDSTPYSYIIQGTFIFELPNYEHTPVDEGQYTYTPTEYDVAFKYVKSRYPDVIDAVGKNKRPKDLCGQHELSSSWDVSNIDKCTYTFTLKITGFGIEYTESEIRNFFLDVFPDFKLLCKQLPDQFIDFQHDHRGHGFSISFVFKI